MGLASFGTKLMSGQRQVVTATVVCPTGAITAPGNIHAVMTMAALAGGDEQVVVAVLTADTSAIVAQKIAAGLNLNADFLGDAVAVADGPDIVVSAILAAADDATMNLDIHMDSGTGMTDDLTSVDTIDGIAFTEIARAGNFDGPALSLGVVDTTAHDSPGGFEEHVPTVLIAGELKCDINYEADHATHDGTTGILYRYVNKILGPYQLRFPDVGHTQYSFDAHVTSFEPSEPVTGKVSASVAFEIEGEPTLTDVYI